jgi:N-acetylglucosamine repressor
VELGLEKATRQHTKHHNSRLVLKTLYDHGELSRADLARLTRLTRTTISDVVANLIERGLVEENGAGPSAGGRSPILLRVVDDSRHLIGVNLTNSGLHGAVVNLRGEIRQRVNQPLQSRAGDTVLAQIYTLIDELVAAAGSPLLGIGIRTPGLIDTTSGTVRRAVNFGWQDLPLRTLLRARYNLPVYVANDSHMAALAEYTFGQGKHATNLVVIKVGQGIGAGIVLNGQLFHGDAGGAGEIGHVVVVENGQQCRCGNFGCLETVANTQAIVARAQAIARSDSRSLLHQFAAGIEAIDIDVVLQAFQAGDQAVQQIILETGQYLGIAVANLVGMLNIQHIFIAGPVAQFGQALQAAIKQEVSKRALPALANATEIEVVNHGPDTALLGASALLLTYESDLVWLAGRMQRSNHSELEVPVKAR